MRKRQPLPAWPDYLREAIPRLGYRTPTDFARAAGISSSVVSRWLNGQVRPDVPLLERVAPFLGARLSTLVRIAYPEIDDGLPIDNGQQIHPLAAELDRRLGDRSTLADDERDLLARLVDSVLDRYRSRPTPRSGTA
jgi:transcriptional regulator with XRE-family HTH domain